MKARIVIEAEIKEPIEATEQARNLSIAYLKRLGFKRVEINSDGDAIILTRDGKHYGLSAERIPELDLVGDFPRIEAIR